MKILIAEHSGFCFGVKRAIDLAEDRAKSGPIVTYGPLIHNSQEIERLRKLGVNSGSAEEITRGQTVMIRTHGVGPQVYQDLEGQNCEIVDATCPYVSKAQQLAAQAVTAGYGVIILGDKEHPEVQGISSWTKDTAQVVKSLQELESLELPERVAVLAQTTEKEERFQELIKYLHVRVQDLQVLNTICGATKLRQQSVERLVQEAELILIIGGKHSSNTQKLWEICQRYNVPSYLVEGPEELQKGWFQGKNSVGISAGASTPPWIVEEVVKRMEEIKEQMDVNTEELNANEEEMPSMNDDTYFRSFKEGDLVKGKVVKVTSDEALIEIGGKSEGIVPNTEFAYRKVDPREQVSVGDELLVEVLKEDKEGNIILSRKRAVVDEAFEKLEKAKAADTIITAKVSEVVKGGLVVDVGVRGFVPASQIDRAFIEDLNQYLHQELRLKVLDLERDAKKVVLSQKVVLEAEYQKQKKAIWSELVEGQTRQGVVKRLAAFGAFVDLGGVDGLLHVSEMSWTHVKDPAQIVKVGDLLEVYVLKVDREKEKVSLTLKQLLKSPWEVIQEKYQAEMVVDGKVIRIVPFGAFIELEPGIEGLAHISQLSTKRVNKVEEVLKVGDKVKAKILEIDPEKKRISLSLKEVDSDVEKAEYQAYIEQQPAQQETFTIGDALKENKE